MPQATAGAVALGSVRPWMLSPVGRLPSLTRSTATIPTGPAHLVARQGPKTSKSGRRLRAAVSMRSL
eukprot:12986892-Alexandrium_andersonii.AAC.1